MEEKTIKMSQVANILEVVLGDPSELYEDVVEAGCDGVKKLSELLRESDGTIKVFYENGWDGNKLEENEITSENMNKVLKMIKEGSINGYDFSEAFKKGHEGIEKLIDIFYSNTLLFTILED